MDIGDKQLPANGLSRLAVGIATLGGVGRLPKAPGTFGTLATLPLCVLALEGGVWVVGGVFLLVTAVGFWASEVASRALGHKDPKEVVVDEAAGMLLTTLFMPVGWLWIGLGFILFRYFDIVKPWPVGWLDRHLPGGVGIMADDLAAGVWAGIVLTIIDKVIGS
ncbi:MAG: phosphatidylglycerophosphatase A [Magnetococcales bacterium]|nr:phosphatidylglycerophosphatase A [Magnetococcales bacterium]